MFRHQQRRGSTETLSAGDAPEKSTGVAVDGSVASQETETGQRVDVKKFKLRSYARCELSVLADQLDNTEHAVQEMADAHIQELVSHLCLNG